ncbi:MAG: energy transducer TonB [Candidatus Acidiferrales bacterium]
MLLSTRIPVWCIAIMLSTACIASGQTAPDSAVVQQSEDSLRRIYYAAPEYPPLARVAKIEGTVTISAQIGTDGTIVSLQTTSGHPLLIRAALDAVKQWRYEPVVVDGRAVIVRTTISVIFSLHENPSDALKACTEKPKLVQADNKGMSLSLPESVGETIRLKFPGLRIPGERDMKDLWATETAPGTLPYFAEGDFNGDGREDFALLLANEKEYWLVIFHRGADCSYSVGYKNGGFQFQEGIVLQDIFLRTVPKGKDEVLGSSAEPMHAK